MKDLITGIEIRDNVTDEINLGENDISRGAYVISQYEKYKKLTTAGKASSREIRIYHYWEERVLVYEQ